MFYAKWRVRRITDIRRCAVRKAIGYVSDIILGRTGEVIKREGQLELIAQYATDSNTDIIAWFEDEMYNEDVLSRPGIQALLAFNQPYDAVVCERVWALSRSMAVLEPFFKELDRRGVTLECATTMWDCVSQKARHRFRASRVPVRPSVVVPPRVPESVQPRIARPEHLYFEHLVK
jgi:DNA invertase Pin-like site-specific DNA recombinase